MPNVTKSTKVTKRNLTDRLEKGIQIPRMANLKTISQGAFEELMLMYARGEVKLKVDTQKRVTAWPKDYVPKVGRPRKDGSTSTENDVVGEVSTEAETAAA